MSHLLDEIFTCWSGLEIFRSERIFRPYFFALHCWMEVFSTNMFSMKTPKTKASYRSCCGGYDDGGGGGDDGFDADDGWSRR